MNIEKRGGRLAFLGGTHLATALRDARLSGEPPTRQQHDTSRGHAPGGLGPRPVLGWRDTLVPMVEATHKQVKIKLEMNQNEDGNWVARCSLKWPDGITEHFAGKYAVATEQCAHASALEQVRQYIDRHNPKPM